MQTSSEPRTQWQRRQKGNARKPCKPVNTEQQVNTTSNEEILKVQNKIPSQSKPSSICKRKFRNYLSNNFPDAKASHGHVGCSLHECAAPATWVTSPTEGTKQ
jgi:hypothetical protein